MLSIAIPQHQPCSTARRLSIESDVQLCKHLSVRPSNIPRELSLRELRLDKLHALAELRAALQGVDQNLVGFLGGFRAHQNHKRGFEVGEGGGNKENMQSNSTNVLASSYSTVNQLHAIRG